MLAFLPNLSRVRAYLLGTMLALGTSVIEAQTQSNIQYTYDAAGNVIGVIRTSSAAKPDLTVSNLSVGKIIAVGDASFTIPVSFQVNNGGGVSAVASWYDRGYLSTTNVLHDTDQVLSGSLAHSTNLAAGASYTVNATLTTSTTTAAGAWTLIVKADGGASPSGQYGPTGANYVDEFNEINNTQSITINLPINPKPDLTVSNLVVGTISASQNGSYNIPATYQVNNVGNIFASPTWYDRGYLSTDAVLDNTDQILTGFHRQSTNLAVGASYTVSQTYVTSIGTTSGSYSLIVKADGGNGSGQYSPTGSSYVQE
ncbi:MAG TPA: CARDB domain-containing protein, partial [Casimicrobiaceae bacterium]|nr:CARDB domain-containing protein [Casimicrobiaceae bacterium]